MKIELNEQSNIRNFDLVHPSVCFIPLKAPGTEPASDDRNVWVKLQPPNHTQAVNLYNGQLSVIHPECPCRTLPDAKVVIG